MLVPAGSENVFLTCCRGTLPLGHPSPRPFFYQKLVILGLI